ncbi:hypothetical protein DZG01_27430 [Pseudomonas fluorescens]|nr:hypothetical protein DZG01_27430 [Pseudomonas fluorescens]
MARELAPAGLRSDPNASAAQPSGSKLPRHTGPVRGRRSNPGNPPALRTPPYPSAPCDYPAR